MVAKGFRNDWGDIMNYIINIKREDDKVSVTSSPVPYDLAMALAEALLAFDEEFMQEITGAECNEEPTKETKDELVNIIVAPKKGRKGA